MAKRKSDWIERWVRRHLFMGTRCFCDALTVFDADGLPESYWCCDSVISSLRRAERAAKKKGKKQ